jgi:transcriptional regulator with XRE-family HTH domain
VSRGKERLPEARLFGATVRRLREQRGWSQEVLAERAEMNAGHIGFIERGDNVPTLTSILRFATALEVEVSDLFIDVLNQQYGLRP